MGRFLRRLQSRFDYVTFVYRGEAGWIIALIFLVLALPIAWLPGPIVTASAAAGIAVTVIGLVRSGAVVFKGWKGARLLPEPSAASQESQLAQWRPPHAESWRVKHAGADSTLVWWDSEVNAALRSMRAPSDRVSGRLSASAYQLPASLHALAGRALRYGKSAGRTRRDGMALPIRFNGRLLRLATEPTVQQLASGSLEFERVTYFDGECSNELWGAREREADGALARHSPVHFYVSDRAGSMLALENSRAANILGITVLGVTSDDHAVLVMQTQGNSVAPSSWSASGSGSLEQRDIRLLATRARDRRADGFGANAAFDASELIMEGMLRELREESLIRDDEIDRSSGVLTAYWRWVARAMKPEFSGLVRVSITADELRTRKHQGAERAFSAGVCAVALDPLLDAVEDAAPTALHRLLAPHGDGRASTTLNPSCEVALRAAAAFLRTPQGASWRATSPASTTGA